jgi:uncharacterized protein (TIRG00374 family)
MKGRIISITAALALLAGLIYFSGPEKIATVLLRANPLIIAAGLSVMAVGGVLRTERWRYLLRKAGISVPFFTAMKIYVASMFLSNVTPGKSGDPIRSVLLKKVHGDKVSSSLPSVIVERALDVGSMVLLGLAGLSFVAASAASTVMPFFAGAMAIYAVIFLTAIFALSSEGRARRMANLINRFASHLPKIRNYTGRTENFMLNMQKSLATYGSKRTIAAGLLYSLSIWLIEGAIFYAAFLSLGFEVPFVAVVASVCVATLVSVLTFLPGGIGSAELITVAFFMSITTLTMADITAAAIVSRALSYWIYVAVGAALLATMKYNYGV